MNTQTSTKPVADLTEGQLYDEANSIMWARHRGNGTSDEQEGRLIVLEAEFFKRHTAIEAARS